MSDDSTPAAAEVDICPICAKPFKADDICATDITEGTCHAECLEGSAVVNLDTGDEMPDGKIATYPYSDVMEPGSSSIPHPQKWTRWQGGKMPVPQGASVEVILRYGKQALAEAGSGYAARWSYDSRHGDHDDIVFYRLCTPTPQTRTGATYTQAECDEMCEIAERDGYEKAVQEIDQKTGGDGEYRYCLGTEDSVRHTPDPATMIQRIVDRFEVLNLLDEAAKTGIDQPDDLPVANLEGPDACVICGKSHCDLCPLPATQETVAINREVVRDIAQLLSGSMFTYISTEEQARARGSELYGLLAAAAKDSPVPNVGREPSPHQIDEAARYLRETMQSGKNLTPWPTTAKATKKKWLALADGVIRTALSATATEGE